jgi:hypothetical protein
MATPALSSCPRCGLPLVAGFAAKAAGLSFVAADKFGRFAFLDEDLARAGWTKLLPSKTKYYRSYLCRGCELYIVDYGETLGRSEATRVAETLTATA